jgi:DNA-directed RNA polymerase subunit H (RpoH/RPB5)
MANPTKRGTPIATRPYRFVSSAEVLSADEKKERLKNLKLKKKKLKKKKGPNVAQGKYIYKEGV